MSTMGERIRQSREKKGLLQAQLAKMIGVRSSGVISNWEKDINKPDGEKMIALCEALDISLSYLLDYYGPEKSPDTTEAAPGDDLTEQIMTCVRQMTTEQKRAVLASFQALLGPAQEP